MGGLGKAYLWFCFHTQFWLKPEDRRPYTYIMRDFYHHNPLIVLLAFSFGFYSLGNWGFHLNMSDFLFILISTSIGVLLGHLFWAKWIEGQQEKPPYTGEEK